MLQEKFYAVEFLSSRLERALGCNSGPQPSFSRVISLQFENGLIDSRRRGQDRRVVCGIVLLLFLRFVMAAVMNLSPQEAYYWNYSIHPDLSYLDHPPMVAWVIRAGTLLLGKSEIGVRIGGVALVVVSTWLISALGRLWFSRRAGLWAALLFQLIPAYFIYGVIITPDAPLICFWLLTIYLLSIAVLKDRPSAWYGAGAALGFAMLSKYTAVFLVPSALLFLIADRAHRKWLLRKEPYLAFFLSLVIFSPVILWNYQHQWVSFAFQFSRQLLGQEYKGAAFDPELSGRSVPAGTSLFRRLRGRLDGGYCPIQAWIKKG